MARDDLFFGELRRLFEPELSSSALNASSIKEAIDNRLIELNLTANKVIDLLGIEYRSLISITKGTAKRVDLITAIKLSHFLGIKIEDFIAIYAEQMDPKQIGEIDRARKASFISSNFDLQQLKVGGFLTSKFSITDAEQRINNYFGFTDVTEFNQIDAGAAFSRVKKDPLAIMRDFWVKSAYAHFVKINNPYPYSRRDLLDLIPKIRPYTMEVEDGLATVVRALFRIGVTVIYQSPMPNVNVRGATFNIKGKPCIVLTDYQKRYTTLWHVLIHELYHALYDMDGLEKWGYHLTGQPDLFLMNDEKADDFARQYLFSKERSRQVDPFINDNIIIKRFAEAAQVHPSFVYAYHLFDLREKGYEHAWGSKLATNIPKSEIALKVLNTHAFTKESIQESVDTLMQTIFNV